jgi:hypothetical protein
MSGLFAVAGVTTHEKLFSYKQEQTASFGVGGSTSEAWNVAFSAVGQVPSVIWTLLCVGLLGGEVMFFS